MITFNLRATSYIELLFPRWKTEISFTSSNLPTQQIYLPLVVVVTPNRPDVFEYVLFLLCTQDEVQTRRPPQRAKNQLHVRTSSPIPTIVWTQLTGPHSSSPLFTSTPRNLLLPNHTHLNGMSTDSHATITSYITFRLDWLILSRHLAYTSCPKMDLRHVDTHRPKHTHPLSLHPSICHHQVDDRCPCKARDLPNSTQRVASTSHPSTACSRCVHIWCKSLVQGKRRKEKRREEKRRASGRKEKRRAAQRRADEETWREREERAEKRKRRAREAREEKRRAEKREVKSQEKRQRERRAREEKSREEQREKREIERIRAERRATEKSREEQRRERGKKQSREEQRRREREQIRAEKRREEQRREEQEKSGKREKRRAEKRRAEEEKTKSREEQIRAEKRREGSDASERFWGFGRLWGDSKDSREIRTPGDEDVEQSFSDPLLENVIRRFYAKRPSTRYEKSIYSAYWKKYCAIFWLYWLYHPELTNYTVIHTIFFASNWKKTRVPSYATICNHASASFTVQSRSTKTWEEPSDELFRRLHPSSSVQLFSRSWFFERPRSTTSITEHPRVTNL